MFRTAIFLAIALSISAMSSASAPAAALSSQYLGGAYLASGASTKLKSYEVPYGQLPPPQVVPPPRPSRCGLTNCLGPSGYRDVSAQSHPARVYTSPGTSRYRFPGKKKP